LTLEEVGLLIENFRDEINLYESIATNKFHPTDNQLSEFKTKYDAYEESFAAKQNESFRNARRQQLLSMKDKILDGRKKKLTAQLAKLEAESSQNDDSITQQRNALLEELQSLESNFQLELKKIDTVNSGSEICTNTEIFVKMPDFYNILCQPRKIPIDQFWLDHQKAFNTCKFKSLRYFWRSGFYLTSGTKFGGDFLVYPGDPASFHSQFILVCVEDKKSFDSLTLKQLITYARMATSVKKTFLITYPGEFATNSRKAELGFLSLNWSHI
jgi:tRNA-splicing endonuclease subunit Sen34